MPNGKLMYYWPVIALAITIVASAGGVLWEVDSLADEIDEVKTKTELVSQKETELEKQVVKLAVTQDAIKEDVDEIKEEQKEQSKKLDRILEKLN